MQGSASGRWAREAELAQIEADTFCAAYPDRVLRFATMASPPGMDPEDGAQDAMVTSLTQLDRFDPDRGSIEAWLWGIVINRTRDAGRAVQRRDLLLERLITFADRQPMATPSAEAAFLDRLGDKDLIAAIRTLPRQYRTAIALRYGGDLTSSEVAVILGTTRMAVVKSLHRAVRRLRKDLEVRRQ
jgi:RNA polymerase sigma-70 factor (ECF subfamily)